jgi:hypothetical protein
MSTVFGCDSFSYYNHLDLGWFMRKKNTGTHDAALSKNMTKTRLCVVLVLYVPCKMKNQSMAQADIVFP